MAGPGEHVQQKRSAGMLLDYTYDGCACTPGYSMISQSTQMACVAVSRRKIDLSEQARAQLGGRLRM